MRLWDKGASADAEMLRFTARDDWQLDRLLLPYDLAATKAHVRGLERRDILTSDEARTLVAELDRLEAEAELGTFQVEPGDEDGHTAIENALVARLGEVGKKVHTGRSRNDQVLVATRLFQRASLDRLALSSERAGVAFLDLARAEAMTPMPGYTHLQRAVPSSVGLWAAAYAEGMADARDTLLALRPLVDRSPLGAAAGYGVNLPLDRRGVADELGFAAIAQNPLWSQTSRGLTEVVLLSGVWHLSAVLRRFAWDLSLFATSEFGFVRLDESLTTGSSIMPQKRNPDVVELLRASCSVVQGAVAELMSLSALPSGYHRDLQLTKAPTLRALAEAEDAIALVPRVLAGMTWSTARMREAITPECYATDRAVDLTRRGVPFREAYRQVAKEIETLEAGDPAESLAARLSYGAPGALGLEDLEMRLTKRS